MLFVNLKPLVYILYKKHLNFKFAFIGFTILLSSCNITKTLTKNEYLVEKNKIVDLDKTRLSKESIEAFIRQKPNRKILLVFPFNLWLYNQVDKNKLVRKKALRDIRFEQINEKRIAENKIKNAKRLKKGKAPLQPKLKDKDKPTIRESILEAAEAPVILDSFIIKQTVHQISKYLFSKGYFYAKVRDSIAINKSQKKAKIYYFLNPGKLYLIDKITYDIPDENLAHYIYPDSSGCLIKHNSAFDAEIMQSERQRITTNLLNNGFYFFETDFIFFNIDSNTVNQKINLAICAKKFPSFVTDQKDSVIQTVHPRFTLNNIYIITENIKGIYKDEFFKDTTRFNEYMFLHNVALPYRKSIITDNIEFFKGQIFQKNLAEKTYKRLLNLGLFRNILIQFSKNLNLNNTLDCYIVCSPLIKQSITIETEGTNTSGNLGIAGNILYSNRNLFKGAELLEIKLNGSVAAQKQFNTTGQSNIDNVTSTFNTLQFGPEIKFSVPRVVFPFSLFPFKKDAFPRTFINSSLNYQERPEFSRIITNINYGFSFRTKQGLLKHDLIPFEVYLVKADLYGNFKKDLLALNDHFLLNSFIDHITTLSKYSITYNNQQNLNSTPTKKVLTYLKVNFASSGNILRAAYDITNQPKDSLGRYYIFQTPFAQFVKFDFDFRLYVPLYHKSRVVYRFASGIGKPLQNLNVLPYEQSFFSGGPNSVRAWRARTLGPGSYSQPDSIKARYDKVGDVLIEANIEYRFHIFRDFFGAWFVDAGNIWLTYNDPAKPNGDFQFDRFYKEFAIGSGFGLRWDLNFFVLRLDAAVPLRDPSRAENDRWLFDKDPQKNIILNFGIGYPF